MVATSDTVVFGDYTTATVLNEDGEVVAEFRGWFDEHSQPITDPAIIARLEASMEANAEYEKKQAVEYLENDDETWSPARMFKNQGNGVYLIRTENGTLLGVPSDRLRPVESGD